ncbi:glycerol kinase GlpK [Geomonas sp. RF6]|uniref:glycerol kinase GlpK n=1 Tax=Geomonas sp. RF6 TaxID=2897342 RepID=UPI001E585B17|nr:glycerol kinase GlpK [Geomonas sp. RF6]UFS71398.1 glycerol kinase GlpK [Geomonas sp. RF6]
MPHLLAIDQGTTSSRTTLFDSAGKAVRTAQREFPQHYPVPGLVEHDPEELWESQLLTLREVLAFAGAEQKKIAAIGITNQRETVLLWEREGGRPLYRALVWQDRRTADFTQRLRREGTEPLVRDKTGLLLDPYFSASKLSWLLDNVDGARERAARGELCFGTVDSFLIYRLTGGRRHVTDVSNASRTLLFNIHTLSWDDDLLRLFRIPREILPEVLPSGAPFGETDPALLGTAIPITGVAGDQQAALFGQACLAPGMAKVTYGTGAFVVMNTGQCAALADGVLTTVAWQLPREGVCYALEGSIFIAGAAVQWLRDGLGLLASAAESEALARSVPDTGGVYFVPALTGMGAPYWDPFARGVICGLTRGTSRGHLARAALEAIAYQTRDAIGAMERGSGVQLRELRVDGGAAANDLLLELQSDLLDTPVLRPACTETTALGAALLAGIGGGVLDLEGVARQWALDRRFIPAMDARRREKLCSGWHRAVDLALGWDRLA